MEWANAAGGSAIVMEPASGEVLAMASYPGFDPNEPADTDQQLARFNHPVSVPFEPGSVFKIITVATALETTNLRPESLIDCGGGTINLFGRVIHEAKRGYGMLSVADVIAKSSNVGAIRIAMRAGQDTLIEYSRKFGFGSKTGVPLPASRCS